MAGNTSKTVHDIFQNMEYGPAATSNTATAQVSSTYQSNSEKETGWDMLFVALTLSNISVLLLTRDCKTCSPTLFEPREVH